MKVDRITYKKIFPLGSYVNESIGVEISLDETDDWEETFALAKKIVNKWGTENQITVNPEYANLLSNTPSTVTIPHVQPIPSIDRKAIDEMEIKIDNAKSVDELISMREDIIKYGLLISYDNKLKQFQ